MPDVPYPITAENSEDLKRQVWELFRETYEERIGGLNLGDIFEDSGGILTLRLGATNPCLQKVANALQVEVKPLGGLQATSTGLAAKLKSGGGLDVDSNGLYVSSSAYGFGTINCPAGNDPVADATNDTLNLVAGTGVTITGDSATDSIAFSVKQQAHEPDAAAVSAISAASGADSIDRAVLNLALGTLVTEVNALKTKINNILSKLESAEILAAS
jgi:hypothetical protein